MAKPRSEPERSDDTLIALGLNPQTIKNLTALARELAADIPAIHDEDTARLVTSRLGQIKTHLEQLDEMRLESVKDLKKTASETDTVCRDIKKLLEKADRSLREGLGRWCMETKNPRVYGDGAVATIDTDYEVEVLDMSKVPRQYMVPDLGALRAMAKAGAGSLGFDGCKVTPIPVVTVRRKE